MSHVISAMSLMLREEIMSVKYYITDVTNILGATSSNSGASSPRFWPYIEQNRQRTDGMAAVQVKPPFERSLLAVD